MIPTYNESRNIAALITEIQAIDAAITILVVDDDSPDGTWQVVEKLAQVDARIQLIRRQEKAGRGLAGACGFGWAIEHGFDYILEMDGDFSHPPALIPQLLAKMTTVDIAIGSRFIAGGKDIERHLFRRLLTRFSKAYVRTMLGVPVSDPNSGFRCFRREVLERLDMTRIISRGPAIVHEILYKASLCHYSIAEVPYEFADRRYGQSNLNLLKLMDGYTKIIHFKLLHLLGKLL
jgi:dolichol-phosphate mannosyltransferase